MDKKICHIWEGGIVERGIYVFDSAGDQLLRPTGRNEAVADPRWSPDGTEIAFERYTYVQVGVIDLERRAQCAFVAEREIQLLTLPWRAFYAQA